MSDHSSDKNNYLKIHTMMNHGYFTSNQHNFLCLHTSITVLFSFPVTFKGLAPIPSDDPVSPPRSGRWDELCSNEDGVDMMPPEHHMGLRDIAHVPTSVSDEDEDWSDTSVSSHVEMPVLELNSEVVCVKD